VSLSCCPSDAVLVLYIVMTPVNSAASDCKEAELALTEHGLTA